MSYDLTLHFADAQVSEHWLRWSFCDPVQRGLYCPSFSRNAKMAFSPQERKAASGKCSATFSPHAFYSQTS
jgi:hypothetical protein